VKTELSRRSFFRMAAASGAAAVLPILTESQLALAQRRHPVGEMAPGSVRIDSNENPLGPSEAARETIASLIPESCRYDFDLAQKLTGTFAAMEGLKPEYVVAYAGSSEPLHYTVLAFTSKDRGYVTGDPGYEAGMFAARVNGAPIRKVPLTSDYAHDVRAMLAADANAGVFYIANPNNPSGTTTRREDIDYLLANKPAGSVLLLDEAYIHFSDAPPALDLVKADKDVILLRTFSKIYGMAGLRCGFAIARPDLLEKLQLYGQNFMPILAVAAANTSLQEPELVAQRKKINTDTRDSVFAWLTANNYKFIPSETNFFMLDAGRPGNDAIAAMAQRHVYIGRVWPIMPNWVRITLGTPEEMRKFQSAWKETMNGPVMASRETSGSVQLARMGSGELPPLAAQGVQGL